MISSSTTSSADRTNPLRTLRNEDKREDDSRAPTMPGTPRPFNGDLPAETSGKRVRPDATVRGIGPNSTDSLERTSPTIEVRSSELECLSEVHAETGELQIPWIRNDFKFVLGVGGGAFLLVLSMLMVMSRGADSEATSAEGKATITTGALGDTSSALNAKAPAAEPAPAQESEPFVPTEVKPLVEEQTAEAAAPLEPASRKAKAPARSTKTRVAKPTAKTRVSAKAGVRNTTKSKKTVRKARVSL